MHLTDFDPHTFLRENWQKTPRLIRNPWNDWRNPVEPDELAGLACERHVESRLVIGDGTDAAALKLEHGPLAEDRFNALGTFPWTLLVQAVDHHIPAVADLIEAFRFIPNWRIDDVMVSYATDTGGVGAHYDQYDVFLIQGLGRRRWELGGMCDGDTPLLPHDDLRLLAAFEARQDFILEPGDILYVPPGIAHMGTAIGHDCMTYSVGFRAPSAVELVEGWTDAVLDTMPDDDADRYGDAGLAFQTNPGEISDEALSRLHGMVAAKLADREAFARWFGTYATAPQERHHRLAARPCHQRRGSSGGAGRRHGIDPQPRQPLRLCPASGRRGAAERGRRSDCMLRRDGDGLPRRSAQVRV